MSTEVAKTILAQLGGKRFIAMTGANSFTGSADELTFKLPTRGKMRAVKIKLEPSDTYTFKGSGIARLAEVWNLRDRRDVQGSRRILRHARRRVHGTTGLFTRLS